MLRPAILVSLVLATLGLPAETGLQKASAQCVGPGCGSASFHLRIPGKLRIHASARVGVPKQVVIVRPGPPPPPPAPVVVVRPAPPPPPPVVVVRRQPQVIVRPAPPTVLVPRQPRNKNFGIRLALGGMVSEQVSMGGGQIAFKYRPRMGFFGLEVAAGAYGGQDYNGRDRTEVPVTVAGQFYFNPRSKFQVYGLVGLGVAQAEIDNYSPWEEDAFYSADEYTYVGGFAGLGAEFKISHWFAINADLRAFIRERTDLGADDNPEFVDPDTGQSTNTSAGVLGTLGANFYF